MCMIAAVSTPEYALVVTDRRWTTCHPDGSMTFDDAGGRLVRTPDGWAAATGPESVLLPALEALPAAEGPHGIRAVVEAAWSAAEADVLTLPVERRATAFLTIGTHEGTELWGRAHHYPVGNRGPCERRWWGVSPPGGIPPEKQRAIYNRLALDLSEEMSLPDRVRSIAGHFARAAEVAPAVSPDIEVGVLLKYGAGVEAFHLDGTSHELADAADDEILPAVAHRCGVSGQHWILKTGEDLDLRAEDVSTDPMDGAIIRWSAAEYFNAGATISVPGDASAPGIPYNVTRWLYYDAATSAAVVTAVRDNVIGFDRMYLGKITTPSSHGSGTTSGGGGENTIPGT
jgi:hypothetical protein